MADQTTPAAAASPQQVPANWQQYNMNMYNMYQNHYMYNPAYQAQYYSQFYGGQRLPGAAANAAWEGYRGFTGQLPPGWGQTAQQQPQPAQSQEVQQSHLTPNVPPPLPNQQTPQGTTLQQEKTDAVPELPPLPPGPPPPNPAPPGTQDLPAQSRPFLLQNPTTAPIRFNMNAIRGRAPIVQANPLGAARPLSKKQKKKKKKQQLLLLQQQQQAAASMSIAGDEEDEEEDEGRDTPPLPSSPPPAPPPPPQITAPSPAGLAMAQLPFHPPLPQQQGPVMVQSPPGFKSGGDDWPPALKEYVNRCYLKCVTKVDSDRVGVILKGKIIRATNDGDLWSKNWAIEPLPLLDSDRKPVGGLSLGLNLKGKPQSRLGPPQKQLTPQERPTISRDLSSHKRSSYRSSFKRNYSSSSSSSSSSDSEDNSSNSKRREIREKRNSWRSSKRHSPKKTSEKHIYKEYGAIGGGAGGPVKKEVLDKRAARFSSGTGRNKPNSNGPLYVLDSQPNPAYVPKTVWSSVEPPKVVSNTGSTSPSNNHDWEENLHIVGTCTEIEKSYLRLTSAPDASQVRPPQILAKALNMIKEKWDKNGDYHYACKQLKSIRQDLTVQGIRDDFTIKVYETHARIALEKGDHAEFNQCQAQLSQLHTPDSKNRGEFIAYRLLYYIFTNEFLDLSTLIHKLSPEDKEDACTRHALLMAKHWVNGVYSRFFKLYPSAPKMSTFLIDLFINRERLKALKIIVKAYRPAVPVDLVMKELAFGTIGDALEFIDKFGLIFTDSGRTLIDCKSSTPILASV